MRITQSYFCYYFPLVARLIISSLVIGLFWVTTLATAATVKTTLEANWNETPLIYDILEHVYTTCSSQYFDTINWLSAEDLLQKRIETQSDYDNLIEKVSNHLKFNLIEQDLFHLAMSLRRYAPRIAAQAQYYHEYALLSSENNIGKECASENTSPFGIQIHLGNVQVCDLSQLLKIIKSTNVEKTPYVPLGFDHVCSTDGDGAEDRLVLVYASVLDPKFPAIHKELTELARQGVLTYVLRYKPSFKRNWGPQIISGYGVELAVKNTEYKVMDDRDLSQPSSSPKVMGHDHENDADELLDAAVEPIIKQLNDKSIPDLSIQAASYILSSKDPLKTFVKISRDFPKYAHILSNFTVDEELKGLVPEIKQSILTVNGIKIDLELFSIFNLMDIMMEENKNIRNLENLGFTLQSAVEFMIKSQSGSSNAEDDEAGSTSSSTTKIFDTRFPNIMWFNNLESDKKYESLSSDLRVLLRPMYPGQLVFIKKNLFSTLFLLDFSNVGQYIYVKNLFEFIGRSIPIRFGVVPIIKSTNLEDLDVLSAFCTYYVYSTHGLKKSKDYLMDLSSKEKITRQHLEESFKSVTTLSVDQALNEDYGAEFKNFLPQLLNYNMKLGTNLNRDGCAFVNGAYMELTPLTGFQRDVYFGHLTSELNFDEYYYTKKSVYSRRNPYLVDEENYPSHQIDMNKVIDSNDVKMNWIHQKGEKENMINTTILLYGNLESDQGKIMTGEVLTYIAQDKFSRVALFHYDENSGCDAEVDIEVDVKIASKFEKDGTDSLTSNKFKVTSELCKLGKSIFKSLQKGQFGVVVNGVMYGPIDSNIPFIKDDLETAVTMQQGKLSKIVDLIEKLKLDSKLSLADMICKLVGILAESNAVLTANPLRNDGANRISLSALLPKELQFEVGSEEHARFLIELVVDPLTEDAQKLSGILRELAQMKNIYIKVYLAPNTSLEKLPLNRFYRFVFRHKLYIEDGQVVPNEGVFDNMPKDAVLTQGMDVPDAWFVSPVKSLHDLDNIKLSNSVNTVDSTFVLKNLLVQGYAKDEKMTPPRGVQFTLGTLKKPHQVDTITMANFGYVQLKANPGVWHLKLRSGRSSDLFQLEGLANKFSNRVAISSSLPKDGSVDHVPVVVISFEGVTIFPRVSKRASKEDEDVLEQEKPQEESMWDSIKSSWFGSSGERTQKQKTINIFSVASGHLYERFLSIMTLSVVNRTQTPVKFWFIENFLSPSFKNFLPHLAKEFKFDYELVTYKWPHWLRKQSEKQRTIWGYKILFLDVLFPLNLDKVIFVDADQVVRTDLKELVDMDLQGAVYGYTPFCNDREGMDQFRFWKSGYWANHLRDRAYHISALYVVDLVRFRQFAAGDRLRGEYHALSADPNSLANLDQDLPNNMIHQIPMFSLPQEWLWCETWCSDESLAKAKTIDLCNNPLTKEPKLARARRIIPEWDGFDQRVKIMAEKVKQYQISEQEEREKDVEPPKNIKDIHEKDEL